MRRSLDRVMRDAHVVTKDGKPKYSPHALRHFFASWCINPKPLGQELSPKVVQVLLGHASIVMTLDLYGHLWPDDGDRAKLDDAAAKLLA
jgi:integrase